MNLEKELFAGGLGTSLSCLGTAMQTNEVLQTISLVITIVGGIISLIVVPLVNWYRQAKQDGTITSDEIKEGIDIATNGVKEVIDKAEDKKKGK